MLFVKRLLQAPSVAYYTLNVVFTPSDAQDAICTLTYDGQAHSATSATVEAGTVISYSIYSSKYGSASGTVTMDADKTLTCTGTTTSTPETFTRPNLTSNGTIGVDEFAVAASTTYSNTYSAYKAVDGDTSTAWRGTSLGSYITIFSKKPLLVTAFSLTNVRVNAGQWYKTGFISASNDNSNYINLANWTNTVSGYTTTNVPISTSNFYKYFRVGYSTINSGQTSGFSEIGITATYLKETYSWVIT